MAHERFHSPLTGRGRPKRRAAAGGEAPTGFRPSWPDKGRMPANTLHLRRKPKRLHPGCTTDHKPHRPLVLEWLRARLTVEAAADVVRTTHGDSALAHRALDVYRKLVATLPVKMVEG